MHAEVMTFVFAGTCKLVFFFNGFLIVVNNGLHKPYLSLTNSSFTLLLSEFHKGCLIWAISKTGNGEWRNGEWGTGNGESLKGESLKGGISKRGNL